MIKMIVITLLLAFTLCNSSNVPVFMNSTIDDYVETPRRNGSSATILSVMALVNYGGDSYPVGPLCTKAIQIALNQLAKDVNWLPGYSLRFNLFDDECSMELPIQRTIEHLRSPNWSSNPLPLSFMSGCFSPILTSSIMKNFNHFGVILYFLFFVDKKLSFDLVYFWYWRNGCNTHNEWCIVSTCLPRF